MCVTLLSSIEGRYEGGNGGGGGGGGGYVCYTFIEVRYKGGVGEGGKVRRGGMVGEDCLLHFY